MLKPRIFLIGDCDAIDCADLPRIFVKCIDVANGCDLVWHRQVQANEVESAHQIQRVVQFVRQNMEASVLHIELARLQSSVLNLRRERVRDGIAEDAETNRRIDMPASFQFRRSLTNTRLLARFFHVIPNECEGPRIGNRSHN